MWLTVEQDGRHLRVAAVRTANGVWVGYPGGATFVDTRPQHQAGQGAAVADGSEIRAPMTGRVVQVAVSAGDKVEPEATLVVLEAMKMEYRLRAPQAGVVAEVFCRSGELVDLGALLVTLSQ